MKKVFKVKFCRDKTWPCVLKTTPLKDLNKNLLNPSLDQIIWCQLQNYLQLWLWFKTYVFSPLCFSFNPGTYWIQGQDASHYTREEPVLCFWLKYIIIYTYTSRILYLHFVSTSFIGFNLTKSKFSETNYIKVKLFDTHISQLN